MTTEGAREQLAAIPWLQSVPHSALDWLAESVEEVSFDAGTTLIVQGDQERDCYFLISGEVEVFMNGQIMGTVGPGEVEGEMALLYRRLGEMGNSDRTASPSNSTRHPTLSDIRAASRG